VWDVTFEIGKGEIVGLLGPNGAGKTTLMKILTCYHFPDFGSVKIGSWNIFDNPDDIKEILGYLPENAPVYSELNVDEYLDFISDARRIKKNKKYRLRDRAIDICGLREVVYKPIDQLSKGYIQRVGLAQAIIHDPDILILDEPTTGLDPNQIIEIRKLITELGKEKTVILSTHILHEVEAVCKRVMIMNEGSIIASGTPVEISNQLKGGTQLQVRVTGTGAESFGSALDNCPEVERLLSDNKKENGVEYQVSVRDKDRASEVVFDLAVKKDVKLVELKSLEMSLEDIFIQLTGKEGQGNE
jgi:ABC-2 type transport system ATP-binding protein